jgi:membrane protease YdiL (CAAX protease family)
MSVGIRLKGRPQGVRALRAHEIVIFWFAALAFWGAVFSAELMTFLPNVEYLAFPAAGLTLIALIKTAAQAEHVTIGNFLGKDFCLAALPATLISTVLTIATGIGGWALLVLIEANINPERTYRVWNLMTPEAFQVVKWSYYWLAVELICAVVVAPITEEIVFRGLIQKSLMKRFSAPRAVLITALIFSCLHYDKCFPTAFIHSVIYSVLAIHLSSLYPGMLVHGIYNFIVTILRTSIGISLVADINRFDTVSYWLPELSLSAVTLLASGICAFVIARRRRETVLS